MLPKDDYICPRCGYQTHHRGTMRNHLYKKLKPCRGSRNNIELTNEIKECILDNKVYIVPKQSAPPTINQVINNYNTINNYVSGIDFVEKITKYTSYNNIEIIDYTDKVREQFSRTIKRLENNMIKEYKLSINDLYDILDETSSVNNGEYEHYNIHIDEKANKVKLYEDGEWTSLLQEGGLISIITGIQEYFLDIYEIYLVRKIYNNDIPAMYKNELREHLMEYYNFISCFGLYPCIRNKSDKQILEGKRDIVTYENDSISESLMKLYNSQKDNTSSTQKEKIRKSVYEIIKRNSKQNLDELNKKVVSLFNIDETFKNQLLTINIHD